MAGNSKFHLLQMFRKTKHFAAFPKWCSPKFIWKLAFLAFRKLLSRTSVTHLLSLWDMLWQWRVILNYICYKYFEQNISRHFRYDVFGSLSENLPFLAFRKLFSRTSVKHLLSLLWHWRVSRNYISYQSFEIRNISQHFRNDVFQRLFGTLPFLAFRKLLTRTLYTHLLSLWALLIQWRVIRNYIF